MVTDKANLRGISSESAFRTFLNFALIHINVVENNEDEFKMVYDHFGEDRNVHGVLIPNFRQLEFDKDNECSIVQRDSCNCGFAVLANIIAVTALWNPKSLNFGHEDDDNFQPLTVGKESYCVPHPNNNHILMLGIVNPL